MFNNRTFISKPLSARNRFQSNCVSDASPQICDVDLMTLEVGLPMGDVGNLIVALQASTIGNPHNDDVVSLD
jgi:hypothetical protein